LDATRNDDIPQVIEEENRVLLEEFREQEERHYSKWNITKHQAT
jgi:hypothetical protein